MAVQVEHPLVLFLALLIHPLAIAGGLALGAGANEVIVGLFGDTDLLHVAQNRQDEGEVVPERGGETQAVLLDVAAQIQLIPRRIELVLVKEAICLLVKLLRAGEYLVRDLQDLAETIRFGVVAIGVDEKAAHHEFQGMLVAEVVEVLEHRGLSPVVGVHEA